MTKEQMKAKRRANRRLKRQTEHQQRMTEKHEAFLAKAAEADRLELERLTKKNQYGKYLKDVLDGKYVEQHQRGRTGDAR